MRTQLVYKILVANTPKHKAGEVFIVEHWRGHRYEWPYYDAKALAFKPLFTCRYLGRITARSDRARIRQLLQLPGTAHLRRKRAASVAR